MSGAERCADTSTITVTPPGPWWQVVDADVQTNGDLRSKVPIGLYFGLPGLGGFPGVAKYGDSTSLSSLNVSAKGWLANSRYVIQNNKILNYAAFSHMVPADIVINSVPIGSVSGNYFKNNGGASSGYYWFKYDATQFHLDLHITSLMNLGNRKVILFVDGADVYFEGDIKVDEGQGFFLVISNKNIYIDSKVTDLQAVFLADQGFYTGTGNKQLHVKGSVAAWGQVHLQRDLGAAKNADTPAEVFEYDPSLYLLYPSKLSVYKMRWKEVAP